MKEIKTPSFTLNHPSMEYRTPFSGSDIQSWANVNYGIVGFDEGSGYA